MDPVNTDLLFSDEEFCISNFASPELKVQPRAPESEDHRNSVFFSGESMTRLSERVQSPFLDPSFSGSSICPAPLCRQFWKAGNYDTEFASASRVPNSKNYLNVHPKFLHSNATSHKWAFGAVAELLDNAVDEIQNGATFVIVDKISNPRDKSPALLIQDDGGGMGIGGIRRCMSFGFSDKISDSAIGRYGNGFKTSTMRLGADVIVFSRRIDDKTLTQSVGLLSYTYLSRTGLDRIVVPMIDYEYNMSTGTLEPLYRYGKENFQSNLSVILKWSPYSTEAELLKQFDDIGYHGTKVVIYNLWLTDDGTLELDFESDPEDIRLQGPKNSEKLKSNKLLCEEHIGNQYRYSLCVYLSILYLRLPQNFNIILRGRVVKHHSIARDLKFPEVIVYKPQTRGTVAADVVTTIGFLKEAPHVNIHGFNVYHKNRLILPFWQVLTYGNNRGRGIVGVLEANFVEPIHNKQDFERTSLFQKLEARLRAMAWEYWDHHCGLVGYQLPKRWHKSVPSPDSSSDEPKRSARFEPIGLNNNISNLGPEYRDRLGLTNESADMNSPSQQPGTKRIKDDLSFVFRLKRQARVVADASSAGHSNDAQCVAYAASQRNEQQAVVLMQENKRLRAKCLEYEKRKEELNHKVSQLTRQFEEAKLQYSRMLSELLLLEECLSR